jgi:hypothetical protein
MLSNITWRNYNPLIAIDQQGEVLYRVSRWLKSEIKNFLNKNRKEMEKVEFIIVTLWNIFSEPPRYKMLCISYKNNNKIIFRNLVMRKNGNYKTITIDDFFWRPTPFRGYIDWLREFNRDRYKNSLPEIHFWDFIHNAKKFSLPLVFFGENYRTPNKNKFLLFKLILPRSSKTQGCSSFKVINGNLSKLWIWEKMVIEYKAKSVKDLQAVFKNIVINFYFRIREVRYVYEWPSLLDIEKFGSDIYYRTASSIMIGSKKILDSNKWEKFINLILQPILKIFTVSEIHRVSLLNALRSAVAAIMARNMSHNIGSHVLNYLIRSRGVE